MGLFKNEVGRPSNETIKKRNIFKLICFILVLIIIGLVCYIFKDDIKIFNTDNKVNNSNKNTTTVAAKEEEVSKEKANEIFKNIFSEEFTSEDLMYLNNDSYKTSKALGEVTKNNLENTKYDSLSLIKDRMKSDSDEYNKQLEKMTQGSSKENNVITVGEQNAFYERSTSKVYDYDVVEKALKKLYGNSSKLYEGDVVLFDNIYVCIPKEKVYVLVKSVWGDGGHQILEKIDSAKKIGSKVYINFLIANAWVEENPNRLSLVLKDESKVLISTEEANDSENTLEKYKDKVYNYKFTFFEEDGVYKFEKVELEK